MKVIPFTIQIGDNTYTGFLGTSDLSDPPTNFFVFMGDFIVGELLYRGAWMFKQGIRNTLLKKLDRKGCKSIADNLGNIAVLAYESTWSREERLMRKSTFERLLLTSLSDDIIEVVFGSKSTNLS